MLLFCGIPQHSVHLRALLSNQHASDYRAVPPIVLLFLWEHKASDFPKSGAFQILDIGTQSHRRTLSDHFVVLPGSD